jgi:hypothetical protein
MLSRRNASDDRRRERSKPMAKGQQSRDKQNKPKLSIQEKQAKKAAKRAAKAGGGTMPPTK